MVLTVSWSIGWPSRSTSGWLPTVIAVVLSDVRGAAKETARSSFSRWPTGHGISDVVGAGVQCIEHAFRDCLDVSDGVDRDELVAVEVQERSGFLAVHLQPAPDDGLSVVRAAAPEQPLHEHRLRHDELDDGIQGAPGGAEHRGEGLGLLDVARKAVEK